MRKRRATLVLALFASMIMTVVPFIGPDPADAEIPRVPAGGKAVSVAGVNATDGFILFDNFTRSWVDSDCRRQLERAGVNFPKRDWTTIRTRTPLYNRPLCDSLQYALTGTSALPSAVRVKGSTNGDGFFHFGQNGNLQRSWISPDCRVQLQRAGVTFKEMDWYKIGPRPEIPDWSPSRPLCDDMQTLITRRAPSSPYNGGRRPVVAAGSENGDGFLIDLQSRYWVSPKCRSAIKQVGVTFDPVPWETIGSKSSISPTPRCDVLLNRLTGRAVGFGSRTLKQPTGTFPAFVDVKVEVMWTNAFATHDAAACIRPIAFSFNTRLKIKTRTDGATIRTKTEQFYSNQKGYWTCLPHGTTINQVTVSACAALNVCGGEKRMI